MSTITSNQESSSPRPREQAHPNHYHQQQHEQEKGEEEEHTHQFSPFSSLPGLAPATTASRVGTAVEVDACADTSSRDLTEAPSGSSSVVHMTRAVFTIRAEFDDESYLTEELKQLEALEGLVALSTESPVTKVEESLSSSSPDKANKSSPEPALCGNNTELVTCTTEKVISSSELVTTDTESESKTTGREANSQENLVTKQKSEWPLSNGFPRVTSPCRPATPEHGDRETVSVNGISAVEDTLTSANFENSASANSLPAESVSVRDNFTQTEGPALALPVDFNLWEARRLACNGWGFHRHSEEPSLFISASGRPCMTTDVQPCVEQRWTSSHSYSSTSERTAPPSASKTVSFAPSASKTVSFATQTRSPSIKPSTLQLRKPLGVSNSKIVKTKLLNGGFMNHSSNTEETRFKSKSNNVGSDPHLFCAETVEPPHDSATSTPFDSACTTPRVFDKSIHDGINSSRSTSVLSDSGTSSSVPSELISTAKPFTDRIRHNNYPRGMADVSPNHPSPIDTSPQSCSEEPGSPHSSVGAPTLKVEYVTKVWDAYISDFLLASDHITEAAIFDRATSSCIAASFGFVISKTEFEQLQRSLSSLIEATKMGVTLKGKHYKTYLADGRRGLMAKGAERTGCSACQTRTLVLVAVHDHTGKPSRCNEEVMRLGDFFWAKGL